jgi:hypothetical protein
MYGHPVCNLVYLSTDSAEDLARCDSERIQFKPLEEDDKVYESVLKHPQKWFVPVPPSGCSCGFRHLYFGDIRLGFGEPEDWCPEDEDDIAATAEFYRVITRLRAAGYEVDCLDVWNGTPADEIQEQFVDLRMVPEKAFRLFEGYHFVFK